jgi:hypothetical protein
VIVADSHEFIELYRGDKDLRMGMEMLKLDEALGFVSFAPESAVPLTAPFQSFRSDSNWSCYRQSHSASLARSRAGSCRSCQGMVALFGMPDPT